MQATCLKRYGPIDNFVKTDLPLPNPKQAQVRVRIHASAIGPADYKVATGIVKFLHGRKFPMILGYDFSGTVDAIGVGESRWKVGDSVFGFLPYGPGNNQGAFAEFLIARSDQIALKPPTVSHHQAAAAATAALTSIQSIRDQGKLSSSNTRVLITGVSGAVGSTGILVEKKLGAYVTAIGSSRGLELAKPVFDSFENAVTDNQRLTSAQGSVGTTSGSGGEREGQAISCRTGGGRLRQRGWLERHRP